MYLRRIILASACLVLIGATSACWVTTDRYETEKQEFMKDYNERWAALSDWLGEGDPNNSYYEALYDWVERVTGVVCDLENFDAQHKLKVRDPLCQSDDPIDPKAPPPPPPDLEG